MATKHVKVQPVRSLYGKSLVYHEVFCGVANADWHAADDSIVSDFRAVERLLDSRDEIQAILGRGQHLGVNVGFMTAAMNGDTFLVHLGRVPGRGFIEVTEHGQENMTPARINQFIEFCNKARAAGYRIVLDDISVGYPLIEHVAISKIRPFAVKAALTEHGFQKLSALAAEHSTMMIAENIETREDYIRAMSWGAGAVQGYYIARPTPIGKIAE